MAQHKVPQDVEADDKLLGPFTFRQFVYLLITAGAVALAVALFQIFPVLAIVPIPFAMFFAILALPLKRDQPMETYLAALVSYYLKPHRRIWMPGQRETTIVITAPKKVESPRTRNLSMEEASRRLSFLADIVDSEGRSIHNNVVGSSNLQEDVVAEAKAAPDILDTTSTTNLDRMIEQSQTAHHRQVVDAISSATARTVQNTQPVPSAPTTLSTSPAPVNPVAAPAPVSPSPMAPAPSSPAAQPNASTAAPNGNVDAYHSKQLAEMRDVIQRNEATYGTPGTPASFGRRLDFAPSETTVPDYSSAMEALLHPGSAPAVPTASATSTIPATPVAPVTSTTPTAPTPPTTPVTPATVPNPNPAPAIIMGPTRVPTANDTAPTVAPSPANAPASPVAPNAQGAPSSPAPPTPTSQASSEPNLPPQPSPTPATPTRKVPSARFINLASNQDYTIETIQKEANRIKQADEAAEVFISLH